MVGGRAEGPNVVSSVLLDAAYVVASCVIGSKKVGVLFMWYGSSRLPVGRISISGWMGWV